MKSADRTLLRTVESRDLKKLDLEDLLTLHKKVRKARSSHVERFRRRLKKKGRRTSGRTAVLRHRATLFEQALSTISTAVARSSRRNAEGLRAAELEQVRTRKASSGPGRRHRHDLRQGRSAEPAGARR